MLLTIRAIAAMIANFLVQCIAFSSSMGLSSASLAKADTPVPMLINLARCEQGKTNTMGWGWGVESETKRNANPGLKSETWGTQHRDYCNFATTAAKGSSLMRSGDSGSAGRAVEL